MREDSMMVHNPYSTLRERREQCPLNWDTSCPYITEDQLGSDFKMARQMSVLDEPVPYINGMGEAFTTETADKRHWSYWPSEPPVLPARGHKWFDYGPIAHGLHLWGQVPEGRVPSAEEQRVQLESHYMRSFQGGKVPPQLNFWLKQHGLKPINPIAKWIILGAVVAGLGIAVGWFVRGR